MMTYETPRDTEELRNQIHQVWSRVKHIEERLDNTSQKVEDVQQTVESVRQMTENVRNQAEDTHQMLWSEITRIELEQSKDGNSKYLAYLAIGLLALLFWIS